MSKGKCKRKVNSTKTKAQSKTISYRLRCAKTANGLSHFVMYGDVPKKETLV